MSSPEECLHEYADSSKSCKHLATLKIIRKPEVKCSYGEMHYCSLHIGTALSNMSSFDLEDYNGPVEVMYSKTGWRMETMERSIPFHTF